ncbi:hypothetical protein PENTCL1PPCAC_4073, partial [Pristionchus entomophagus]
SLQSSSKSTNSTMNEEGDIPKIKLMEENEALKLKVSQLTKEIEERKEESDAIKAEFDRYKLESQDTKKYLELDVKLKSNEIEHLKELQTMGLKSEAELRHQLAKMKIDIESKTEDMENIKLRDKI